jgi:PKD repeat protein
MDIEMIAADGIRDRVRVTEVLDTTLHTSPHMMARAAIGCVKVVCAIALLGCNPDADRMRAARSAFTPLAPTTTDVVASSAATVVSWACLTSGVDRDDFAASGWTIKRDPCQSSSASRVMASGNFAPVFAPAPTNLRASITGTTVQLDWDQPPNAVAWQLEAGSGPGLSNVIVFRTITRTLTVTGVPDGFYYVRVRSAPPDFSDLSIPSNEIVVGVSGCRAQPTIASPTNFGASVVGNQVTLSWKPPRYGETPAPTSYILEVGSAPGFRDLVVFDTRTAATSLQATAPNGVYYLRIYARTPCATSDASNEITIAVPSQPVPLPPAPVADFSFARYAAGQTCSYRGCLFDATPSTGSGLSYFWDFADGSTGTGLFVLHVYARPAALREMTVVLTVVDAFGRTSTKARAIYIGPNY